MITNNSYLSGLIHRGMRKKLLESFNEIYILNLHGNSRKGEKCPDGSKDENVFDIMQGVSIILLVKDKNTHPVIPAQAGIQDTQDKSGFRVKHGRTDSTKIFYQDVYGLREKKYDYLNKFDITSTKWVKLQPTEPYYFFIEKDFRLEESYKTFISLKDVFTQYNAGIATGKDEILVDFQRDNLMRRLSVREKENFFLLMKSYNVKNELVNVWYDELQDKNIDKQIQPYNYRIFDKRFVIYNVRILQRARDIIMKHLLKDNYALVTTRILSSASFQHAFINVCIGDRCFISNRGQEANYYFPLYLYPEKEKPKKHSSSTMMIFEPKAEYEVKKPNINQALIEQLTKVFTSDSSFLRKQESRDEEKTGFRIKCGMTDETTTPKQIFYYIYAVLYSNTYRTKYAEFLKIDFPRIPFTKDYKLFIKMADYGQRLVDLHLLKSKETESATAQFNIKGKNEVEKVRYEKGKVYINKEQYFEGVKPEIWEYQIGGYQVCDKWLKDRKGMLLSADDIKHYCQIVSALQKTIEIQKKIDTIYPQVEKQLIKIL
jgi:predicted helicase